MDLGLNGKVALVAAASKGLGRAVALGFAREGARVAMFSRDAERIRQAADQIRAETNTDVLDLMADVTKPADIDRVVAQTIERFGQLDALVTNAGGPPAGSFETVDAEAFAKAIELNLMSTIRLCQA